MRVLMLGWEFPPHISGGLGTACHGLTRALSQQAVEITFVLPRPMERSDEDDVGGVRLVSPNPSGASRGNGRARGVAGTVGDRSASAVEAGREGEGAGDVDVEAFERVTFRGLPAMFASPYGRGERVAASGPGGLHRARPDQISVLSPPVTGDEPANGDPGYSGDLVADAHRYAQLCVGLVGGADAPEFDVIHAHDWLTFPAGVAVAAATGKPLVVHVHSTEYDRAGQNIDTRIYEIERAGLEAADRIIAVSHLTRSLLESRYGVAGDRIQVVYNGIHNGQAGHGGATAAPPSSVRRSDKIVLFLGRITMQKGPEYFVAAAKKVLAKYDKVKFVMAGTGDKVADVIELAAREGLGHKVLFTGFLKAGDVERVFRMADVYVMPSVSEPFGIAALEAISHDVPVIISRQSGVSEVLRHALKVDFWDTDEIANKILALLKHPPLGQTLREHADLEVRRLTWDDAATHTRGVYDTVTSH